MQSAKRFSLAPLQRWASLPAVQPTLGLPAANCLQEQPIHNKKDTFFTRLALKNEIEGMSPKVGCRVRRRRRRWMLVICTLLVKPSSKHCLALIGFPSNDSSSALLYPICRARKYELPAVCCVMHALCV